MPFIQRGQGEYSIFGENVHLGQGKNSLDEKRDSGGDCFQIKLKRRQATRNGGKEPRASCSKKTVK